MQIRSLWSQVRGSGNRANFVLMALLYATGIAALTSVDLTVQFVPRYVNTIVGIIALLWGYTLDMFVLHRDVNNRNQYVSCYGSCSNNDSGYDNGYDDGYNDREYEDNGDEDEATPYSYNLEDEADKDVDDDPTEAQTKDEDVIDEIGNDIKNFVDEAGKAIKSFIK